MDEYQKEMKIALENYDNRMPKWEFDLLVQIVKERLSVEKKE